MQAARRARRSSAVRRVLATSALVVACTRCASESPPPPVHLSAIELGSAVDADGRITAPTRTFSPDSTVYASIQTEGVGKATLHVVWVDANRTTVQEDNRAIDPRGPARFALHAAPAGGWPLGKGRVGFALAGEQGHTAEFEVR
jgi:hypothetical protein